MNLSKQTYKKYAEATAEKTPCLKNCIKAFLIGGFICTLAQGFFNLYKYLGIEEETVKSLVPVTLIFIAVLLTGLDIFDDIAKHAGAGTLVPITGFANAVASPAIDTKAEGFILGVGAKIFTIAGSVILYGILSGAIYGVIYYIVKLIMG